MEFMGGSGQGPVSLLPPVWPLKIRGPILIESVFITEQCPCCPADVTDVQPVLLQNPEPFGGYELSLRHVMPHVQSASR